MDVHELSAHATPIKAEKLFKKWMDDLKNMQFIT
jgi:hypothetical protein